MQRGIDERRQSRLSTYAVSALLALVSSACGQRVLIAEQVDARAPVTTQSDAGVGVDANFMEQGNFMCGHSRCTNHPAFIASLNLQLNGYACCYDVKRSACGVVEGDNCFPLNAPGHVDMTCPTSASSTAGPLAQALTAVLGVLPGCCTPVGMCGLLESNIGIGCIQLPPGLGTFATCDYKAGASP
jgi:hypothetical protein